MSQLAPKWVFTLSGSQSSDGISATPTVSDNAVYFPAWDGNLYSVNATTGVANWQEPISNYDGTPGEVSRNSPLVLGNELILGDNAPGPQSAGAQVFAVNRADGSKLWSTTVDTNQDAIITSSPVAYGNEIVVGVASNEEADAAVLPGYQCCTFRGAVVALDATTGKLLWKTYTVPSNTKAGGDSNAPCAGSKQPTGPYGCGYTGGAVWATPTILPSTNQVFVGTGNNYTTPDAAEACAQYDQSQSPPVDDSNCTASNDYFDSVMALNLKSGAVEWGHKVQGYDAWTVACAYGQAPGATWCPSPNSPDFDFGGSSPNLITINNGGGNPQTYVGDGQKSGVYWVFNPANGKIVWDTLVGAGTSLGGIEWGSASDGQQLYVPISDFGGPQYGLEGNPSDLISGGSWAGLNPMTGAFNWQTPTPDGNPALGPVSVANGVMYGESMNPGNGPNMFALNAATGQVLWSYNSGASVIGGASIVDGTVYWGSGYTHLGSFLPFTGNDKLYAFTLGGK
ncbi:MAG TPA: PQQ-binding-like beta-propeller repeat protein [Solirubrobacteraceae bacterium]|nr:PQQ-binding-like beta-propeller repeat protein [Solirubrobacteraceae bacterium]